MSQTTIDYHLSALPDLMEYLGETYVHRNGQVELRDKWLSWQGGVSEYYKDCVNDSYLFDNHQWHASGTLTGWGNIIKDHAHGVTLDFGGGIGTYSLIMASSDKTSEVWFYDINEANEKFTKYRIDKHSLAHKVKYGMPTTQVDTIVAIDVLEHMPDRVLAVKEWVDKLNPGGVLILTHTTTTSGGQHPMHLMTDIEIPVVAAALSVSCTKLGTFWPQVWVKNAH